MRTQFSLLRHLAATLLKKTGVKTKNKSLFLESLHSFRDKNSVNERGHVAALVRCHMNGLKPKRGQYKKQQKQCRLAPKQ